MNRDDYIANYELIPNLKKKIIKKSKKKSYRKLISAAVIIFTMKR